MIIKYVLNKNNNNSTTKTHSKETRNLTDTKNWQTDRGTDVQIKKKEKIIRR